MIARELLQTLSWLDLVDVLAVAIIVYNVLLLIRGTRAAQILFGILSVVVVYYVARVLELLTLKETLEAFLFTLPVVIVVLFQNQIRRALTNFAKNPLLGFAVQQQVEPAVNEIVLAATTLASLRTGALIVVERGDGLRDYVENGITLDAVLSYDLLINIFNTATPLHDGAVIVQGGRLAGAACFLPLTLNPEVSKEFGTRHRAALRISQETDALAVVVSEETGQISVTVSGEMLRSLDSGRLRTTLYRYLITESQ